MNKVIVAGGRDFDDWDYLIREMSAFDKWRGGAAEIVSGCAPGADRLGERFAEAWNWHLTKFPADWAKYKRGAGFYRNKQMAEYADVLVAFWDGESNGTKHMIDTALKEGLEVHVYRY